MDLRSNITTQSSGALIGFSLNPSSEPMLTRFAAPRAMRMHIARGHADPEGNTSEVEEEGPKPHSSVFVP